MKTIMSKKEELQHLKELLIQALKRNDKYDIKYLTPRIVELIEFNYLKSKTIID